MLITADHGNIEKMRDDRSSRTTPHTAHTTNLVPLAHCRRPKAHWQSGGNLAGYCPYLDAGYFQG
jgi:2,3-bisphosphoglycerate-independent phosphoglycerate mutase